MLRTIWNAKSAMYANQDKLDSISNNIGNSQTVGYKKLEVGFSDLLTESLYRNGYPVNDEESLTGTGVKTTQWIRNFSQGSIQETMINTDIAIDGEGLFRLISPNGEYVYTRDGSFKLDSLGRITDGRGNLLDLQFEPGYSRENVEFTYNNLRVDKEGGVYISNNGNITKVGKIPLYNTVGSEGFLSMGESIFVPNEGAEVYTVGGSSFYQGALEMSNVDMAQEMTEMIITQRAFQLASKGLQTGDEMWGMINNLR